MFRNLRMPLRIGLLMLLLSMQGFTLAHELDQSIVHEGGVCAVCSISGGHDGAIAGNQECPAQIAASLNSAENSKSSPFDHFRGTAEARAPPRSH